MDDDHYKCINRISSPPFKICTSRRYNIAASTISNVNIDTEKLNKNPPKNNEIENIEDNEEKNDDDDNFIVLPSLIDGFEKMDIDSNILPPLSPTNSDHVDKSVKNVESKEPIAVNVLPITTKEFVLSELPELNKPTSFVLNRKGVSKEFFKFIDNTNGFTGRTEIVSNGDTLEAYLDKVEQPNYQIDRYGNLVPIENLLYYVFDTNNKK